MLTLFPESGRIVPEYDRRDLRELLFQNYRIVYRVKGGEVQIAAVGQMRRPVPCKSAIASRQSEVRRPRANSSARP